MKWHKITTQKNNKIPKNSFLLFMRKENEEFNHKKGELHPWSQFIFPYEILRYSEDFPQSNSTIDVFCDDNLFPYFFTDDKKFYLATDSRRLEDYFTHYFIIEKINET